MKSERTKYYGIYVCNDDDGWWLSETRGGCEKFFDHKPTEVEIDNWRDELCEVYSI